MEPVIEVAGIGKHWPQRTLFLREDPPAVDFLSNVSFTVTRGEVVVILGENGAGKTTLLKIVAGLAKPDSGTVRVLGRVAYGGGERGFYFRLTVRENLAFFGALDGVRDPERGRRIAGVAQTVDLEGHLDRRFADLSTGLQQRLVLARALLPNPEILLLDEPTRALDPIHATAMRRLIRETLAASGTTIVVATNLIEEALALGDRIAVLRGKRLEFVDLPKRAIDEREMRELFGMARGA